METEVKVKTYTQSYLSDFRNTQGLTENENAYNFKEAMFPELRMKKKKEETVRKREEKGI